MKRLIIIAGLVVLIIVAWFGWRWIKTDNQVNYRTTKVERGDIVKTVSATGVVQPVKLVQVGTQVTGPIVKLYVDFNSSVKKGEIIAQIDPAVFEAHLAQDEANLIRSKAEVKRVKANLIQAEKEWERAKKLYQQELISESELDTATAAYQSLSAQMEVAEANVEQSKSTLQMSRVNLQYTTIRSPVDGVVISRDVNEGQTVVTSLSAQTLFAIAQDLKKMKIEASVPEADVGKIAVGQPVKFTVDAYPEIKFEGIVSQVRLVPTTVQNVVTYTVIIDADNPEEKLFPGMTANLTFEITRREEVLKVPNAALRFEPPRTYPVPHFPKKERDRCGVWIPSGKGVKMVPIKIGITDGSFTEVIDEGKLKEGQEVVTGIIRNSKGQGMVNPFGPTKWRRGRRR